MKKVLLFLLCSVLIMCPMSASFADSFRGSDVCINSDELISNSFSKFLSIASVKEIEVINSSGEIIENEVSDNIKSHLLSGIYYRVFELLEQYDLSLYYRSERSYSTRSIGSDVNRTEYFYHLKSDTTGKFKKEWLTIMRMTYRENSNGTLTALGNPRITIEADFGSAFAIETSNMTTKYRYLNNNKQIEYSGSYRMRAKLTYPLNIGGLEFPIGKWFDWGTISVRHIQK